MPWKSNRKFSLVASKGEDYFLRRLLLFVGSDMVTGEGNTKGGVDHEIHQWNYSF